MEWFQGEIAAAIAKYKEQKNAVLVVFLYDGSDTSKSFESLIESTTGLRDKNKFVAIKIESTSAGYTQFVQIYQLVPLPSLFFINSNGAPIEIATNLIKSSDELEQMIQRIVNVSSNPVVTPTPQASPPASQSSGANVLTNEEVAQIEILKAERLKRAQDLIEKNKKEQREKELKTEQEREIARRQAGKTVQSLKDLKADLEMKQLKEDRIKEKLLEKLSREKVLLQISQDREERAKKFAAPAKSTDTAPVTIPSQPIATSSDSVRIQFKMDNGSTHTHVFKCSEKFADLYAYAKNSVVPDPLINFSIVMTFPRTEFSNNDHSTLLQLGLYPSASLLIITKPMQVQSVGMFSTLMLSLYQQISAIFGYLQNFIFNRNDDVGKRKRNEEILADNDAAKRRNLRNPPASGSVKSSGTAKSSGSKRVTNKSNIHRLHDNDSDSDDLNTYNGNSTEQL